MQTSDSFRRVWWLAVPGNPDALPREYWVEVMMPSKEKARKAVSKWCTAQTTRECCPLDGWAKEMMGLAFLFHACVLWGGWCSLGTLNFPLKLLISMWHKPGGSWDWWYISLLRAIGKSTLLLMLPFLSPPSSPLCYSQACNFLHVFCRESRRVILGHRFSWESGSLGDRLGEACSCNAAFFCAPIGASSLVES